MQSVTTRVFVVDDDPAHSSNAAEMLNAIGLSAEIFRSSFYTLVAVARDAPDLIIWNVNMPLTFGVRLVECVNLRYPCCRSILISDQMTKAATSHPFARIVPKPLELQLLVSAIRELGITIDLSEAHKLL